MKTNPFDLRGKIAVVTGGNGGIGKGIADGLAAAGADIVIAARNEEKTRKAAEDIQKSYGVRVFAIKTDVAHENEIREMVQKAGEHFGGIHILVNNAGTNIRKMPQEYVSSEWDQVMAINLRAPFLCCQAVYPVMKAGGGGKIVNIGSMTSIFGGAKLAPYGASKGGVVQMTRSLAVAWGQDNIQVNAILPGWIDTELTIRARKEIEGLHERAVSRTPAGRWGTPADLAGTAVMLCSRASDFVTGVAIPVDGGFSTFLT
ncbi:MAG: glucose 1-dehydrogenase [Desulfobacteraceae bacterium]|nr:MAG: glucose 1-dehydrogenase [Desulfobacteraceae bacterium]